MEKILENLLKKENVTIKELKIALQITSNKDLFVYLCSFLCSYLEKINFNTFLNKHHYLYRVFTHLSYLIEHLNHNNEQAFSSSLKQLRKSVSLELEKKGTGSKKIESENKVFLNKIKNNINAYLLKLAYYAEKDHPDLYDYMKFLILKIHNYDYVYESIRNNNELIQLTRKDDFSLFEFLLLKDIEFLSDHQFLEVVYYERIMNLFLNYGQINISPDILNLLESKIKEVYVMPRESHHLLFLQNTLARCKNNDLNVNVNNLSKIYDVPFFFASDKTKMDSFINGADLSTFKDARDKYVFTLDSDQTQVFDDAISFEKTETGYELGIYIADVADNIPFSHPLLTQGVNRGENLYLPDKTLYLFPRKLAKNILSLNQGQDKPVFAFIFQFDFHYNVQSFTTEKAIIRVRKNTFYSDVENNFLTKHDTLMKHICLLYPLVCKLDKENTGKKLYHDLKENFRYTALLNMEKQSPKASSYLSFKNKTYKSKGQKIITELKVLVNSYIASYCKENKYPFIYRASELKGDKEALYDMLSHMEKNEMLQLRGNLFKSQLHSYYTPDLLPHEGLEKESYCHATNPIINIVSTLNQKLLNEHLFEGEPFPTSDLDDVCDYMNTRMTLNKEFVNEYTKVYFLKK